jgi:hypothetical protein
MSLPAVDADLAAFGVELLIVLERALIPSRQLVHEPEARVVQRPLVFFVRVTQPGDYAQRGHSR